MVGTPEGPLVVPLYGIGHPKTLFSMVLTLWVR